MSECCLCVGVAGLGRAFTLMLPTFLADPRVQLVAACDPRAEARAQFVRDFSGKTYPTVQALADDAAVEVVYVSTPHPFHAEHAQIAAARGKHVLFSQAAHQMDIVRLLAGSQASRVRAATGSWDASRPTEGAYAAFLWFDDGVFAKLTYSGYAHFDSDEF